MTSVLLYGVPILFVLGLGGVLFWFNYKLRYKTARSNQALIITGGNLGDPKSVPNVFTDDEGRSMKVIRGGGHFLRMTQTATPVDLTSFQLSLRTPRIYTHGGVPIVATAVAMVAVSDTLKGIAVYAEQFLGKKQDDIESEIGEVLNAHLRAILSKMSVEEINADREAFNKEVQEVAQRQLDEMGFKITALGLTDISDADPENGYLENLGKPRIAEARKKAEMAEADAGKETRIHKAKADQQAKEEEYLRETEIAESKKSKDLKDSIIREETERAKAKADQSFDLEQVRLRKEVQDRELELEADRKNEELRIRQLELEKQVVQEQENAKIRKEKANADYYETTKRAEAEAQKSRIDGETKAKIQEEQGRAEARIKEEQGRAEAFNIKERGKAEAESIRLKGLAEAEAQEKKAEAMAKHKDVVLAEKLIETLPLIAKEVATPLSQIESIKIMDLGGEGKESGVNQYTNSIIKNLTALHSPLKEMTGIDITQVITDVSNKGNTHTKVVVPSESIGQVVEAVKSEGVDDDSFESSLAVKREAESTSKEIEVATEAKESE